MILKRPPRNRVSLFSFPMTTIISSRWRRFMDVYLSGAAAPDGRFNYRYQERASTR